MRSVIAATLLALTTTGAASAATIDLGAYGLSQGAALTEDQRTTVDLTDAFGFLMSWATTVSDNPRAEITLSAMGAIPVAGDLELSYAPRLTGTGTAPALAATGTEFALDGAGAAILFTIHTASDAVPGLNIGDMLYAVLTGPFANYAGGDWTDEGRLSLYATTPEIAPIPLPAGAVLLVTGLGALAAMRRKRA